VKVSQGTEFAILPWDAGPRGHRPRHRPGTHYQLATMAATQEEKPESQLRKQESQRVSAVISKHVLHALGQPANLQGVQVRPVWKDHYRVNVLVGLDPASVRVAHSYFLVADGDGNIVACAPRMTKVYQGDN
jgi:hypothetical protein